MALVSWGKRLAFYCLDKFAGLVNPEYVAPSNLSAYRTQFQQKGGIRTLQQRRGIRGLWQLLMMSKKWQQHCEVSTVCRIYYSPLLMHREQQRLIMAMYLTETQCLVIIDDIIISPLDSMSTMVWENCFLSGDFLVTLITCEPIVDSFRSAVLITN